MKPIPELVRILSGAYRCSHFDGVCHQMLWKPELLGHIPRGFTGGFGTAYAVRLVICLAEPGNPKPGTESYDVSLGSEALIERIASGVAATIEKGGRGFHGNLGYVLQRCWPDLSIPERLQRTWITEATLCSAHVSTASIDRTIEDACAARYLKAQLDLFPQAFVLALGQKAEYRLARLKVKVDFAA